MGGEWLGGQALGSRLWALATLTTLSKIFLEPESLKPRARVQRQRSDPTIHPRER